MPIISVSLQRAVRKDKLGGNGNLRPQSLWRTKKLMGKKSWQKGVVRERMYKWRTQVAISATKLVGFYLYEKKNGWLDCYIFKAEIWNCVHLFPVWVWIWFVEQKLVRKQHNGCNDACWSTSNGLQVELSPSDQKVLQSLSRASTLLGLYLLKDRKFRGMRKRPRREQCGLNELRNFPAPHILWCIADPRFWRT